MRIRKNAKLSTPIDLTGSRAESVHVCELNQSPWDVIPFAQEPYPSYLHHQFETEDSFNGNGSLGDSVGAVESATSMMDGKDKSIMNVDDMVINDDDEMKMGDRFEFPTQCEDEGMGSKRDCSLKSRSHDNDDNPSSLTSRKTGNRRGRARAGKKGSAAASNPYEFYYYSGFRPSRGRRIRGGSSEIRKNIIIEGKDVEHNSSAVTTQNNNTTPLSSSHFDNNEEFDYVDDEDDDDDEDNVDSGGKKRTRKPVKARSLKSLM